MLRLLIAVVSAAVAVEPVTVLPRPQVPAPATSAGSGAVRFQVVPSVIADPGRGNLGRVSSSPPLRLRLHAVVAASRYAIDFRLVVRVAGA